MVEPVNLRQFRKRKERDKKAAQSADNRQKHGLTKTAKNTIEKMKELERKRLDGKKLEVEQ